MTDEFPIGARVEGTGFVLIDQIRGYASRGLYRAADERIYDDTRFLVTTTNHQKLPLDQVQAYLGFFLEGVAPFCAVGTLTGAEGPYHALVEEEPPGRPTIELGLPLPPQTATRLALDVAKVVARAHKAGWVLSYLRPELMYAQGDGADLALSGVVIRPELFVLGAAPHSSGMLPLFDQIYSAPEVLALVEKPPPAADVFSLCACLGRWLTGQHPFAGDTVQSQAMAIMTGQGRPWQGPEELGLLVSYGLELDPARRISLDRLVALLDKAANRS